VEISVRKQSGVQVLKLRGNLRLGEAVDAFRQTTRELLDAGETRFVLNAAEISMIDSSGIGALVRTFTSARQKGGGIALVQPSKLALQTLRLVGLLHLFPVFQEESEAIASFKP